MHHALCLSCYCLSLLRSDNFKGLRGSQAERMTAPSEQSRRAAAARWNLRLPRVMTGGSCTISLFIYFIPFFQKDFSDFVLFYTTICRVNRAVACAHDFYFLDECIANFHRQIPGKQEIRRVLSKDSKTHRPFSEKQVNRRTNGK